MKGDDITTGTRTTRELSQAKITPVESLKVMGQLVIGSSSEGIKSSC